VLLFQAATSLSFRFLVVMPFAGFSGITFGERPENPCGTVYWIFEGPVCIEKAPPLGVAESVWNKF
jgi:hypothetical protein